MKTNICRYCGKRVELRSGKFGYFWCCRGCMAKVGCHPGTETPMGTLANKELAEWRKRTHAAFDPIWQNGAMNRADAYGWLAKKLGIRMADCHIAIFEVDECKRAIEAVGLRAEGGGDGNR